ncbi:MAG TPA: amidohydrolase family protein [Candidatus Thermoplasmatota archaeon]|nr:amidohydrolase family protein [Candidatus Thermoplasmatota archaeon]
MHVLAGRIHDGTRFVEGWLGIDGSSVQLGRGRPPRPPLAEGVVVPCPLNAHTHAGDAAFAGRAIPRDLATVVAPPDGLKHRWLRQTPTDELAAGMRDHLRAAAGAGMGGIVDFREGGVEGARLLRAAAPPGFPAIVLGRPDTANPSDAELAELVRACDGIGLSAIRDVPWQHARRLARAARNAGKLFALHASEGVREPIERILDLAPDFVVHMCAATDDDLRALASAGIPLVVTPRANEHWGLSAPFARARKAGCVVGLGTDNAMLADGDVFAEARRLRERGAAPDDALLESLTLGGWKALNREASVNPLAPGGVPAFAVFDDLGDPFESVLGARARLSRVVRAAAPEVKPDAR